MRGFYFKLKNGTTDFELNVESFSAKEQDFLREILRMVDRKSVTSEENKVIEQTEKKYEDAIEGYNALYKADKVHKGVDEYIALSVEDKLKEESEEDKVKALQQTLRFRGIPDPIEAENEKESEEEVSSKSFPSIRINSNNKEIYQTFYICPKCGNRGKRFLPKESLYTSCHSCFERMRISIASKHGFPNTDSHGNIFVAGDFIPESD